MSIFSKNVTCSYCGMTYPEKEAAWRCNSVECTAEGKLEADPVFNEHHKLTTPVKLPRIIPNPKMQKGTAVCEICGNAHSIRICKNCHSEMPDVRESLIGSNIVCPYCFSRFAEEYVQWRCNQYQCSKAENLELDSPYFVYHKAAKPRMPHIIPNPTVKGGFAKCDKCGGDTNFRICPVCHSKLPDSKENIIISIVGVPGAGKSYYVGTLLRQLRMHINRFDCNFRFTTTDDEDLYNDKFERPFSKHIPVIKTAAPTDENNFISANTPILCNIQDSKCTRTFTFFDAAGENFDDPVIMQAVAKYLQHSAAILLLLDPTQITEVQGAVSGVSDKDAHRISYTKTLTHIMDVIRSQRKMKPDTPIDIPIAIVFTKWDLIENSPELSRPDSITALDSPHFQKGFSLQDCDNISMEVESRLAGWHYENFLQMVQNNFKTSKFFAVSAIGAAPDSKGVPQIVSKRVEDPFLWLLHSRKMIVK